MTAAGQTAQDGPGAIPQGAYSTNIGFLNPDITGGSLETVTLSFSVSPEPERIFLPLTLRQ